MPSADLLLHPVRLRVVQAFLGDRTLTTSDLRAELPDVPTASLYRHVGVLADAGVLTVVGSGRCEVRRSAATGSMSPRRRSRTPRR
ncbi:helix-turn-helix domain-containing protein [Blastococcus brunescens]|uniref:Helix-turn-helix domain-containing protein n=1 Tax=Blastococcus brunescens TaxID=1564165 RepID=A0ABZ1AY48_9ACTN|nr:helix-turn-helix domain-containing protein [Blastococcus sp. BMG 8361]WRL62348.1 helix-turn-helix domain-containing protein [Blastococcus sp. BMG 8361]